MVVISNRLQVLFHYIQKFKYYWANDIIAAIKIQDKYHYIDFENKRFTFIQAKHLEKIGEQNPMKVSFRQSMKPGKFIKSIADVYQSTLDEFIRLLYFDFNNIDESKFLLTKEVSNYYREEISSKRGPISKSCMKWRNCIKNQVVWYDNEEEIDLLVMIENGIVKARCLIWHGKFHDRVYYDTDNTFAEFQFYLISKGYIDVNEELVTVVVSKKNAEFIPYLDRLCYYNGVDTITNKNMVSWEVMQHPYPSGYINVFNLEGEKVDVELPENTMSYRDSRVSIFDMVLLGSRRMYKTESPLWQIIRKNQHTEEVQLQQPLITQVEHMVTMENHFL